MNTRPNNYYVVIQFERYYEQLPDATPQRPDGERRLSLLLLLHYYIITLLHYYIIHDTYLSLLLLLSLL